ncbi:MAG: helix-turn-helix transcriptional regulator [Gammaproteobacteria bacterium]|nr:MAG: helix-turn-helix transcriptional regulator [Gammaproteobacteria bacterium]
MATRGNAVKGTARNRTLRKRAAPRGLQTALGVELRRRRTEHPNKMSQVELSREAGLSDNVAGSIERGIYNPTVRVLEAISKPLGVKLSELFAGAEQSGLV